MEVNKDLTQSLCLMTIKVLQVIPYSYLIHSGWLEKIAQTLSDGLNKTGTITVRNVASDIMQAWKETKNHRSENDYFLPSFEIVHNFPCPKLRSSVFRNYMTILKKWKPDIIITHTRFFLQSMIGGVWAKCRWCKRIHIEHGSWFVLGYPRYIKLCAWLFDRTIGLRIFRQCDQIVTISQANKPFIKKFTQKEPLVIYNPIDFISQEKIKNTIPHIGFVGRLVPLKGVDILIKTLGEIRDREWICTIVGSGNQEKYLHTLAKELWLSDRIQFVGADDRANWLHRFDIFVNPSYQEWLPTTVVEALLAKCVVVATDVWGTKEISDQKDLILVESWNIEVLKNWIEKAFESLHADHLGESHDRVREKFGMDSAVGRYREIIF